MPLTQAPLLPPVRPTPASPAHARTLTAALESLEAIGHLADLDRVDAARLQFAIQSVRQVRNDLDASPTSLSSPSTAGAV